ncbi:MAG: CDP-glycerol glycerophosphotransferase family protein [Deltaproteobacteria bacterium]|jgi:hypothetical protein|nr:CDP-glycerol glycerophosphotransferase family protein [Deltaproteobacteria bacterium]
MSKKADGPFWVLWLLILSPLCPARAEAYLDPGTGSMLLSALVGVAATIFFLLKDFCRRLSGTVQRLKGLKRIPAATGGIVFYSEGAAYWNTFRPVLEALDRLGQKTVYLSSDPADPGLSHPLRHGEARCIGSGSRAFAVLNMLEAGICALTTPGLDVLQIRRSPGVRHYAHLVHAPTDAAIYKLFSFDYFDSVLCSGPHQIRSLRHLEKLRGRPEKLLLETGCLYLDVLAERLGQSPPQAGSAQGPRLLLAPTWGANGLLSRFGEKLLTPLARSGFPLTIRPHPQSLVAEKALIRNMREKFASLDNVRWDCAPDGFAAMAASDILISDLSGIVFDYAFVLERPVITVQFTPDIRGLEASDLPWPAWELDVLPELGARLAPEAVEDLPGIIAGLPDQDFRRRLRELRRESLFNYGRAGETAARQLLAILRDL